MKTISDHQVSLKSQSVWTHLKLSPYILLPKMVFKYVYVSQEYSWEWNASWVSESTFEQVETFSISYPLKMGKFPVKASTSYLAISLPNWFLANTFLAVWQNFINVNVHFWYVWFNQVN